eukprot:364673-Chlamydomonas_euryale.AAC.2
MRAGCTPAACRRTFPRTGRISPEGLHPLRGPCHGLHEHEQRRRARKHGLWRRRHAAPRLEHRAGDGDNAGTTATLRKCGKFGRARPAIGTLPGKQALGFPAPSR